MKLIKTGKEQASEVREVPGLLRWQIDYEIKSAEGALDYCGPKLEPAVWHQVMSFFRWTFNEMQSESQARLYVNHKLGRWGAWAFPQAARTGLSAREVAAPETPDKARERFAFWGSDPSDDWLYFGTVHHHCALSAFQSSTDEQNERNQDGLHLTVGKMDAARHDLHARLYLGGHCFEPDLSAFWAIDPDLAAQVPPQLHDELARFQMAEKITVDFPEAWRANVIPMEPERRLAEPIERMEVDYAIPCSRIPFGLKWPWMKSARAVPSRRWERNNGWRSCGASPTETPARSSSNPA